MICLIPQVKQELSYPYCCCLSSFLFFIFRLSIYLNKQQLFLYGIKISLFQLQLVIRKLSTIKLLPKLITSYCICQNYHYLHLKYCYKSMTSIMFMQNFNSLITITTVNCYYFNFIHCQQYWSSFIIQHYYQRQIAAQTFSLAD